MPRLIYRTEAVRQYIERSEKAVLPRFAQPRTMNALWMLSGLLFIGLMIAWQVKIPRYISGKALITKNPDAQIQPKDKYLFAVFVDPAVQTILKIGQEVIIYLPTNRISSSVFCMEPQIMSPDSINHYFNNANVYSTVDSIMNHPSVVVYARIDSLPGILPISTYLGGQYRAEIEIGSQQILSLIPFIGRLFSERDRL